MNPSESSTGAIGNDSTTQIERRTALGMIGASLAGTALPASLVQANLPAATRKRGYAQGPHGLVHFHDAGGDGIPVVLSHQSPQSSRQFDRLIPELIKRGLRPIAIDTPGFGMSDVPNFVPHIEDYATAFPCVLDHLQLANAHFAGHHTGAQIVTEVALQFPQRVRTLIMHGPNPMTDEARRRALAATDEREKHFVYEPDGSHLMKNFQLRWKMYGPGGNAELTTRVIAEKFIGLGPFWYGHHASFSYAHEISLKKIRHRALIMTNTGDEIYAAAQVARELRPDFDYVELQGGTIDIVDQQPEAWAEAVARFING
jgi:pimeloyl-ACP methyl ester carboxylesterase